MTNTLPGKRPSSSSSLIHTPSYIPPSYSSRLVTRPQPGLPLPRAESSFSPGLLGSGRRFHPLFVPLPPGQQAVTHDSITAASDDIHLKPSSSSFFRRHDIASKRRLHQKYRYLADLSILSRLVGLDIQRNPFGTQPRDTHDPTNPITPIPTSNILRGTRWLPHKALSWLDIATGKHRGSIRARNSSTTFLPLPPRNLESR